MIWFELEREINSQGIEGLVGECEGVPIVCYREKDDVNKVRFRLNEKYVKNIIKVSGGVTTRQRFNYVGEGKWTRDEKGRDCIVGKIFGIPIRVYGKKADINRYVVSPDVKELSAMFKREREYFNKKRAAEKQTTTEAVVTQASSSGSNIGQRG